MKFIWIEIVKFLKKNLVRLFLGILIITGLFVINSYRSNVSQLENIDNVENLEKGDAADFVVESKPAFFQFIVEYEDGSLFNNPLLIEEYLLQDYILELASTNSKTNLVKVIDNTENNVLVDINDFGYSKVVGVYRDDATYINEFYVNVGNESENLRIANFFYNYINEGQIPFIADKQVYFFEEPKILPLEEEEELSANVEAQQINFNLVKNIILGAALGLLITLAGLLCLTFISKKLNYSFSYTIKEDDYYFLVDDKLDYENELTALLFDPASSTRVLISEKTPSAEGPIGEFLNKMAKDESIEMMNSFLTIKNPSQVERLIYLIEEDVTSRQWYNNQRRLDRSQNLPTIIIQVNKTKL